MMALGVSQRAKRASDSVCANSCVEKSNVGFRLIKVDRCFVALETHDGGQVSERKLSDLVEHVNNSEGAISNLAPLFHFIYPETRLDGQNPVADGKYLDVFASEFSSRVD